MGDTAITLELAKLLWLAAVVACAITYTVMIRVATKTK